MFRFLHKRENILIVFCAFFLFTPFVFGSGGGVDINNLTTDINWSDMAKGLIFGLAIFLFGMTIMEDALRKVTGNRMKQWLKRFTMNRFAGVATGGMVTAIIQSSSVTTVMLVSFVSAELMVFSRAIPVLLGANIGTTITAQLLAFKITEYVAILFVAGWAMTLYKKSSRISGIGLVLLGLALIFLGMSYMSNSMQPLRDYKPFMDWIVQMNVPWKGILVGAAFTALVQSSSATMGVIVALASAGLITIEAGIALALGANVGTCITAGLAAIGKSREAMRVALAHIIFNIVGALIFVMLIPHLTDIVLGTSGELKRQVANAHTVFNVAIAIIFLPFTNHLADLTVKLLPSIKVEEEGVVKAKYLVSVKEMNQPMGTQLAIAGVQKEIHRMGMKVKDMFAEILPVLLNGTEKDLDRIRDMDVGINTLNHAIAENIHAMGGSLSLSTKDQMKAFGDLWSYPEKLESAADGIKNQLVKDAHDRMLKNVAISEATQKFIKNFHAKILTQFTLMLEVIHDSDLNMEPEDERKIEKKLRAIVKNKKKISKMRKEMILTLQLSRFGNEKDLRLEAFAVEIDMIEHLQSVYHRIKEMAKVKRPRFIEISVDDADDMEMEIEAVTGK